MRRLMYDERDGESVKDELNDGMHNPPSAPPRLASGLKESRAYRITVPLLWHSTVSDPDNYIYITFAFPLYTLCISRATGLLSLQIMLANILSINRSYHTLHILVVK